MEEEGSFTPRERACSFPLSPRAPWAPLTLLQKTPISLNFNSLPRSVSATSHPLLRLTHTGGKAGKWWFLRSKKWPRLTCRPSRPPQRPSLPNKI